jgi:propionyl-CoA carboxylase alpha chain
MPDALSFDTLLVANRGEIAVRVMRTCKEQGLRTVAVYSEADRDALHVRTADVAVEIGPAPSAQSYLRIDKILETARATGAQAIHPGYGFLSENADFARACTESGITFIGPTPEAIEQMGDKTAARKLMREAGIPMAPGTTDAIADANEAQQVAESIGYPVLVKAAAGGGGKGMRVVENSGEFATAFERARSEALNAFGDGRVYIERYLRAPRHIEIQILADQHGNVVYLHERECSIQRRHQKVIEEAPSALLTPARRAEMGEAAVAAARACRYVGAGTVEFLVEDDEYYFLEMNTRLQVEHPVTEMITGLDLVSEQLRIARGETLGYSQEDVTLNGHAIECRIYAENVPGGFLPDPGPLYRHRPPLGPGVRVDSGVEEGDIIPIHYDPMISKLSTWAPNRQSAIRKMEEALDEYEIVGVHTTIPLCREVMSSAPFVTGDFSTAFIGEHLSPEDIKPTDSDLDIAGFAALEALSESETDALHSTVQHSLSPWRLRRR